MKDSKRVYFAAVLSVFREYSTLKELGETIVDIISEEHRGAVELHKVRDDGVIIRKKSDESSLGTLYIQEAVADAVTEILNDNIDEVIDYLSDNYDLEYKPDRITSEFAQEMFEINQEGRLVTIEIDA